MFRKIISPFPIFSILLFFLYLSTYGQENTNRLWSDIDEAIVPNKDREIIPQKYRTLLLNTEELKKVLIEAPLEFSKESETTEVILELPLPEGKFGLFRILESPVMETGLAVKYPRLKTYLGEGLTKGIYNARFDFTPAGFHAMIRTKNGTVYIDPYSREDITTYISYNKRDYLQGESARFVCKTEDVMTEQIRNHIVSNDYVIGEELRVYRLALAATGEYTIFHGGTVAAGMNAVVVAVNRVNMIFENEVSIRMVLVSNNDILIYTNPENDPYTDNDEYKMMNENQSNLDAVIGNGNYDIGHVFGVQGSSVAEPYVVCRTGVKARGVTELSEPSGDPFYVDHVAHELGHQFGASHSFNGNEAACNDAGVSETSYEPGSGSTIMSYSGMCGTQNIQTNSDDYFHGISQSEIISYSTQGSGNSCPVIITTGNNAPMVTVPSGGFYIPKSTPFSLTGSAADPNGDEMTYCWEEFDLGPTGHPNFPSGNAPIFRSFKPEESSTRIFPKISDIINNTQTIGEILPGYSRNLTFRLTARDNRAGGGGVGKSSNVTFSVANNAGPFTVTSPNTNVVWPGNTQQTITWNVANTNSSPVNCANVSILLSLDGGLSFPVTLLSITPNDGSEDVTIPNLPTSEARIKIEAVQNIFFDISNSNFTITNNSLVNTFNLIVLFEGLFNGSTMMSDTVIVELKETTSPYNLVESRSILIDTAGTGTGLFMNTFNEVPYYIIVKHRNSVETWSASGQQFLSGTLNYNFTTSQNNAYENNLVLKESKWCIYSGDTNQDGLVNNQDVNLVFEDNIKGAEGYLPTDLNGDLFTEIEDLNIVFKNSVQGVEMKKPPIIQ